MAKADMDYPKLVELLKNISKTRENLANKINCGKLNFAFTLMLLDIIGVKINS
ncbi:DUF6471 domain-containing protein [uncultured Helicobacter sp.]|uniref:DUF6471 domain-containing protein n=1 Tax=uncultured Helicobacter sp. TaxID=175537 RepID=UPI0029434A28|nr:DUF6471 domain-containing protein [uncultured Helicobacter sp.]